MRGPGRAPFVPFAAGASLCDALRDDRQASESGPGILHTRALEEDSHQIRRTDRQRGWKKPVDSPVKRVVAFEEDPSKSPIWPGIWTAAPTDVYYLSVTPSRGRGTTSTRIQPVLQRRRPRRRRSPRSRRSRGSFCWCWKVRTRSFRCSGCTPGCTCKRSRWPRSCSGSRPCSSSRRAVPFGRGSCSPCRSVRHPLRARLAARPTFTITLFYLTLRQDSSVAVSSKRRCAVNIRLSYRGTSTRNKTA